MLSPETLQQLYQKWQDPVNKNEEETLKIYIDEKAVRSNKRKNRKPGHIITTWTQEDRFLLGQKMVNKKSNGITAISKLLEKIQTKERIVTIDALETQT